MIATGHVVSVPIKGQERMITQAIKRWLDKMFAWWPWRTSPETAYAPVPNARNTSLAQDTMSRSTSDGIVPPSGVAPLAFGPGETSCSTIEEWPERVVQPSPLSNDRADSPGSMLPASPPSAEKAADNSAGNAPTRAVFSEVSPTPAHPTPEQHLEFLHYLVQRGLVNEGFPEGQVPEQYRRNR